MYESIEDKNLRKSAARSCASVLLNRQRATILCPITGFPCEGDLSHLCEDYGCARKGGLSPHSEENS
jgi:hypothetical protein